MGSLPQTNGLRSTRSQQANQPTRSPLREKPRTRSLQSSSSTKPPNSGRPWSPALASRTSLASTLPRKAQRITRPTPQSRPKCSLLHQLSPPPRSSTHLSTSGTTSPHCKRLPLICMHRNWRPCVVIVGVHPTNQPNISTHTHKKRKKFMEKKKKEN